MLNRHEKLAIFNLSVLAVAVLLFIIFFFTLGLPEAQGAFGMIGFTGIGYLIFMRKKTPSEIVEDERDTLIKLKSYSGGYSFALAYFIITSLAIYFSHSEGGVVSVELFPVFTLAGLYIFFHLP